MAVALMNAHFIWWDGTSIQETHINNILENINQISTGIANGFLILVLRYCDPDTLVEYDNPKLGHWIGSMDNYYVNTIGNGHDPDPDTIEYAVWNEGKEIVVHELNGRHKETNRTVDIDTLEKHRIFEGISVSDHIWESVVNKAKTW